MKFLKILIFQNFVLLQGAKVELINNLKDEIVVDAYKATGKNAKFVGRSLIKNVKGMGVNGFNKTEIFKFTFVNNDLFI